MNWTLQIDERNSEPLLNAEQLNQRLHILHEAAERDPFFAILNAPNGATLAIGLGRKLSVLSYTAPGGWPAKHVVNNDKDEHLLNYKFLGHFSEMPARYAVPLDQALDVAVEFFKTGQLTARLHWEDD
jgi:hypothetical protein